MEKNFVEIGNSDGSAITIPLKCLNRHGIIAGSTGTGKSRAMQVLAEQLTEIGISVFVSDVKGDVCGFGKAADQTKKKDQDSTVNVNYWSIGNRFIPLRFSVSDIGTVLLSKLLELNQTQESHLSLAFSHARKVGTHLNSLSDLSRFLSRIENDELDGISNSSLAVIQRKIIVLQESELSEMFGTPSLEIQDLSGLNVLNLSDSRKDMAATLAPVFLLNKIFNELPEVGDLEYPKYVVFIDEAHYLFKDSNKSMKNLMSTILKQIRSKGVGVFFITQEVADIPEDILSLLATKIIFAQKIFTERGINRLRAIANSFPKSGFNIFEELKSLPIGFAILSTLDKDGTQTTPIKVIIRRPITSMKIFDDAVLKSQTDVKLISKYSLKKSAPNEVKYLKQKTEFKENKETKQSNSQGPKTERNSKILDGVLDGLLKVIKFIVEVLKLVLGSIAKPCVGFFKYLTKKPIRILWFLVFLLILYIVYVNWSMIAIFLSSLNFTK